MRGQRHAPAAPYPEKDPVPVVQEAGWASGPVWTGAAPTGIRSPDRPARRQSLYRLRYPAYAVEVTAINYIIHYGTVPSKHTINKAPPPSADFKNAWSYTPAPPTCLYNVGRDKLICYRVSTSALTKHSSKLNLQEARSHVPSSVRNIQSYRWNQHSCLQVLVVFRETGSFLKAALA